jgi:hypothetical protein
VKVLVACEFSGIVREAFANLGHTAISCDLLPNEKTGNQFHYQGDVRDIIDKGWDLMIAHPPCTYTCVSGNGTYAGTKKREEGIEFFRMFLEAPIPRIAIEHPVSVISTAIRPPDQYIQPWQFGHPESKKTGLWLKNLPKLTPTNILPMQERWDNQTPSGQNKIGPSADRWKERSRTYQGIADAMAQQWGNLPNLGVK